MSNENRPAPPRARPARPMPAPAPAKRPPAPAPVAEKSLVKSIARYQRQDLYAIAEIAYHYLLSGGVEIAYNLYAGLVEAAPAEAYFALALGLTEDKRGNVELADQWYARAAQLDPNDPRIDINRAELLIERKDFTNARALLSRALKKASVRRDEILEAKAGALYVHITRR